MTDEMDVFIDEHGWQAVYDDRLADVLAEGETRRASHVEPVEGGWQADLSPVGGPVSPVFALRTEALAWEVAWLRESLMSRRMEVS